MFSSVPIEFLTDQWCVVEMSRLSFFSMIPVFFSVTSALPPQPVTRSWRYQLIVSVFTKHHHMRDQHWRNNATQVKEEQLLTILRINANKILGFHFEAFYRQTSRVELYHYCLKPNESFKIYELHLYVNFRLRRGNCKERYTSNWVVIYFMSF